MITTCFLWLDIGGIFSEIFVFLTLSLLSMSSGK